MIALLSIALSPCHSDRSARGQQPNVTYFWALAALSCNRALLQSLRNNAGTTVEAGGFQPPDWRDMLLGFSPGLTAWSVDVHPGSRFHSPSTFCAPLKIPKTRKDQTAAEAGSLVASAGRLKPNVTYFVGFTHPSPSPRPLSFRTFRSRAPARARKVRKLPRRVCGSRERCPDIFPQALK